MENQINLGDQNAQQIGQNPTNQPMPVQEGPKINFWMISTLIMFLMLIATGIYAFNIKNQQINNLNIPTPTPTFYNREIPTEIPTQEPTKTPTQAESPMQIFRNENFGYEILYPKTWQKTDNIPAPCPDTAQVIGTGSVVDLSKGGFSQTKKDFIRPRLQIEVMPLSTDEKYWPYGTDVEKLSKAGGGCFIYSRTDVAKRNLKEEFISTKNGQKMFVTTASWDDKVLAGDTFFGCGYVIANKYLYILTWHDSQGKENPELKEIFTTMNFFNPGRDSCKQQ
jgi:hypothetical protein